MILVQPKNGLPWQRGPHLRKSNQAGRAKEVALGRKSVTLERESGSKRRKRRGGFFDMNASHPSGRSLLEMGLSSGQI